MQIRPNFSSLVPQRSVLSQSITPASSVLNLGVTFDESCCFYHIRNLRRIRLYISVSVEVGKNTLKLAKLQSVQNCLARVVMRFPRFSRSVPLVKSLNWLHFHYRIIYQICTITYQALSSIQPAYLNSMHSQTRHPRQLGSISNNPLHIPRMKTKGGNRAFSIAAKTMWNSLLASVKLQRI